MAGIVFQDNSIQVKNALRTTVLQYLEEASEEIKSAAKANSRADKGHFRDHWEKVIQGNEAIIGHPFENAIWEEFGTGEYAAEGNGRKGGWYVHGSNLSNKAKSRMQKRMINGEEFYFTRGKTPNKTLTRAYDENRAFLKELAEDVFKQALGG